jgi:hypothetical protein
VPPVVRGTPDTTPDLQAQTPPLPQIAGVTTPRLAPTPSLPVAPPSPAIPPLPQTPTLPATPPVTIP